MSAATASRRQPLFQYPSLPKWELRFCMLMVTLTVIYAWSSVAIASNKYVFRFFGSKASVTYFPVIGLRYKDESNWEWSRWSPFARSFLPHLIFHSLIFNIVGSFIPKPVLPFLTTGLSLISCCILFTPWLVFLSLLQGTFVFTASHYVRNKPAVWVSALPILYYTMHHSNRITEDPFLVLVFVAYTLLSYISYNLEALSGEVRKEDDTILKRYFRMLFYAFYPPYMISLIVLYPEFERQLRERELRPRDWRKTTLFAVKIAFWWMFIETALHFFYFEAMLYDTTFAQSLPKDQFVAAGMALGAFFHLKYVIIFGVPALFARLDNMQPPDGPICIQRVALYSKIWREFDRGLYSFFKKYIFVPICEPTFSIQRKIFGVIISYGFVLLWHGFYHHNIVWIVLNITELFVEYGAKGIYSISAVRAWREAYITDVAFRRILAWLQIIPLVFGIYSNFYFLGGPVVGYMFVQRIWNEETITLQYPFFILITLGYFYTHITMECEIWSEKRKKIEEKEKE